ncbi:hypothetical protein MNB_SV-6-67 [hydrothermal vent metagenome]|uniref:Extracellular Matrix protein PelB n=1 Tax=hydrothermal vent metagenome TaxID=652676 RepID=A0A1W1BJT6_9ZZZZ
MSRSDANRNRVDFASYREIVSIFIIFAAILYSIYPKDMQKKQVLAEKSNYALSAVYLENMLRLDPENLDLLFATVKADIESGHMRLANKLIEILKDSKDAKAQEKYYLLKYKLLDVDRKKSKDENMTKEIESKMIDIIHKVSKENLFDKKYAMTWYKNAKRLSQKEDAFKFLEPFYGRNDNNALKRCIELADEEKYVDKKLRCLDRLVSIDTNISKEWLVSAYTMYSEYGEDKKALNVMKRLAQVDSNYSIELARLQRAVGDYKTSSDLYMSLYRSSRDKKVKKEYLIKAIETLQEGDLKRDIVSLLDKYQESYIDDDELMMKFIKIYLAIEELPKAKELSLKLLEREKQ